MTGIRFYVVATLLRGGLKNPELLDDANQWRAFSAWRMDESREARATFELLGDVVIWSRKPVKKAGIA